MPEQKDFKDNNDWNKRDSIISATFRFYSTRTLSELKGYCNDIINGGSGLTSITKERELPIIKYLINEKQQQNG